MRHSVHGTDRDYERKRAPVHEHNVVCVLLEQLNRFITILSFAEIPRSFAQVCANQGTVVFGVLGKQDAYFFVDNIRRALAISCSCHFGLLVASVTTSDLLDLIDEHLRLPGFHQPTTETEPSALGNVTGTMIGGQHGDHSLSMRRIRIELIDALFEAVSAARTWNVPALPISCRTITCPPAFHAADNGISVQAKHWLQRTNWMGFPTDKRNWS